MPRPVLRLNPVVGADRGRKAWLPDPPIPADGTSVRRCQVHALSLSAGVANPTAYRAAARSSCPGPQVVSIQDCPTRSPIGQFADGITDIRIARSRGSDRNRQIAHTKEKAKAIARDA